MWKNFTPDYPIIFFSMEIGLDPSIPTYSGGLGILAGDILKAAADLGLPMAGVSLIHRKGYFHQHLDAAGNQTESPTVWSPEDFLEAIPEMVTVTIEGRKVKVRAWRYTIQGVLGRTVPVYFLDTGLPENHPYDQTLTDQLYGGDIQYRLCQEAILGLAGVAMLRALGYEKVQAYHMNEGHSALLTLALLDEKLDRNHLLNISKEDREAVRRQCVFTTHTPVPAGHDQFPLELVQKILGDRSTYLLTLAECWLNNTLNMTYLGLFFSHYINGVAMRHGEISRNMFPNYPINSITNGVHALTWTSDPFKSLFDRHIPEWRRDNLYLRYAISIPREEIAMAHRQAKEELLGALEQKTGVRLDLELFTIGFARRMTPYKRPGLLFSDPERLRAITREVGPIQIIFAGKAHPRDESGKALIRNIFESRELLKDSVRVVFLEGYDMTLAKLMCAGVDIWLNTPQKPQEASGTSGMKAALNGVPSLSVLDGWWIEGCIEGVTGWSVGGGPGIESDLGMEAASLYEKLERVILPLYYLWPEDYAKVMRYAIAYNASFFNAQRMVLQYLENAYIAGK
ncbi:MAG: alpha-glucan family phosphorylase [bacterium]|nr:alpha-glucan family phosphorylase [bacterium]